MIKKSFKIGSTDHLTKLNGLVWQPEQDPDAVLVIVHGMSEHIGRYDEFARFLTDHNIAVIGHDHLGHGASVRSEKERGFFAEKNGDRALLMDMRKVQLLAEKMFPGKPVFMLGHSMGSFFVRRYMAIFGKTLAGCIISGTGCIPYQAAAFGHKLTAGLMKVKGSHGYDTVVDMMAIGQYVMQYGTRKRPGSWLSRNTENADAFAADPRCGFRFTLGAYHDFMKILKDLAAEKGFDSIPRDLPVLMISGMEDPLGGYSKDVLKVYNRYIELGMTDMNIMLYPDDRHEILNETDRDVVYRDVLSWLTEKI